MAVLTEIYPLRFSVAPQAAALDGYLADPSTRRLVEFFEKKGLATLLDEEQREQWYDDWIAYQADHQIYARVLSPRQYSTIGASFDLLRYARFLEVFGYFSAGHGYSVQVTSLGLFAILMGDNDALKHEAIATLERGGLLAFGVSEKQHGSDLLGNEFTIRGIDGARFIANGSKYYIGNCNVAEIICTLAHKERSQAGTSSRRAPIALFALRPSQTASYRVVRKIHTLGVRAGFVGEFDVKDHQFPACNIIAEGRQAWDAVLGAVTLGKFFLSFGSIGICEHALAEALDHVRARQLYGKPVFDMPHIRSLMTQGYARLTAMKLFAYRAIDYVQGASSDDRRYLLVCAVQKARVSTEGVKVMALLSECIGAKAFETDTFFEMALRDIQLLPGLESSAHINFGLAAQFAGRYFDDFVEELSEIGTAASPAEENAYLFAARGGALNTVAFANYLDAYRPLRSILNVRLFARQVIAFRRVFRATRPAADMTDTQFTIALGQCLATIVYGQLIAEHARLLSLPGEMISAIFHGLITDLNAAAVAFNSLRPLGTVHRNSVQRLVAVPRTTQIDWDFVARQMVGAE